MNTISISGSHPQCPSHVRTSSQDELITEHLSLVRSIAVSVLKSIPAHVDRDDLIQAGMKGLIQAASKYTPGRGTTFPTYASHRIRGAILDSLRQLDPASRDLRTLSRKAQVTREQIRVKLEREPSDEEIRVYLTRLMIIMRPRRSASQNLSGPVIAKSRSGQLMPSRPSSSVDCSCWRAIAALTSEMNWLRCCIAFKHRGQSAR